MECEHAGVAQLVEQLICNQQVAGSSPITSSIIYQCLTSINEHGEILKWPTRADCKSADYVFGGSNPPLTTIVIYDAGVAQLARASAFQAEGRGFESRLPLHILGAV